MFSKFTYRDFLQELFLLKFHLIVIRLYLKIKQTHFFEQLQKIYDLSIIYELIIYLINNFIEKILKLKIYYEQTEVLNLDLTRAATNSFSLSLKVKKPHQPF